MIHYLGFLFAQDFYLIPNYKKREGFLCCCVKTGEQTLERFLLFAMKIIIL